MPSAELKKKGTFSDVVLPGLLVQATNARFTGMFRAERESIIKVIYFKEGEIAFASSNQPSDRLGEVLIKRGQLTREQLDMAMSKLEANVSLGRMLVELGYLSPKELLSGAKTQVEEILYSLNTWTEGNYEFVEGPLPPRIVDLKLNTRQVIFQCILQVEDRNWVLQHLGSMDTVFAPEPEIAEALQNMRLEPEVHQVIANIDGSNTVRDLAARSRLDEFTVSKIVSAVHLLNLARVTVHQAAPGGEFLSRFGEDESEASATDRTTIVNRLPGSETLPGFQPSYEEDATAVPLGSADTFSGATMSASGATVQVEHAESEGLPRFEPPEAEAEGEADDEIAYEEEGIDDDEPKRRSWLIPAAAAGAVVIAGAAWYFGFRTPSSSEPPTTVAVNSPAAGKSATPASTPRPVASVAAGGPSVTVAPHGTTSPAAVPSHAASPTLATTPVVAAASPSPAHTVPLVASLSTPAVTPITSVSRPPTPVPSAAGHAAPSISAPTPMRSVVASTPIAHTPAPTAVVASATHTPLAIPTRVVALPSPSLRPATPVATSKTPPLPHPTQIAQVRPVQPPKPTPRPLTTHGQPPAGSRGQGSARVAEGGASGLPAGASTDLGRSALAAGKASEAAHAFEKAVSGTSGYSLQLEIDCQESSLREGLMHVGTSAEFFVLPYTHRGRACYRVLWGVFPSRAAAERGAREVPAFFRNQLHGRPFPVVTLGARR